MANHGINCNAGRNISGLALQVALAFIEYEYLPLGDYRRAYPPGRVTAEIGLIHEIAVKIAVPIWSYPILHQRREEGFTESVYGSIGQGHHTTERGKATRSLVVPDTDS